MKTTPLSEQRRTCPECASEFTPTNGRQEFCTGEHREAHYARQANRGKILVDLAQAYRLGKRQSGEVSTFAFREMCSLLDTYNAEDRDAGRLPAAVAERRMNAGWRACDVGR